MRLLPPRLPPRLRMEGWPIGAPAPTADSRVLAARDNALNRTLMIPPLCPPKRRNGPYRRSLVRHLQFEHFGRISNILHRRRPHALESRLHLVLHMLIDVGGNRDSPRIGDRFQARRDIDAFAEHILG